MSAPSRIALGSAQFGMAYGIANRNGQVTTDEAHAILSQAQAAGIDTVDTAIAYGQSETVLGAHGMQDWQVVSKLPAFTDDCDDVSTWVWEQVMSSMARLKVTQLHGILLHRPAQLLQERGIDLLHALRMIKHGGLTRKIGVSVYSPDELSDLMAIYPFDMVQIPFSILDRRLVESGWAQRLKDSGVEIHTRSAFLQGLLLSEDAQGRFPQFEPLWRTWAQWLDAQGLSAMQACVRYALSQPAIDKVVLGFDSVRQFLDIQQVKGEPLPELPRWPNFDQKILNPAHWNPL